MAVKHRPSKLIVSIKYQTYMKHSIFSLHAISGCDTTSRIFGKGKTKLFNIKEDNEEYWAVIEILEQSIAVRHR